MAQFDKKATVTLGCQTSGASIRYTDDGTEPSASSQEYSSPFVVYENCTIKVKGIKDGLLSSDVASSSIAIRLPSPTIARTAGTAVDNCNIAIGNASEFANYRSIVYRYTLDGTDPTSSSPKISGTVNVTKNCTVKVAAYGSYNVTSPMVQLEISDLKVQTPTITVN